MRRGSDHYYWKGDNTSYKSMHEWLRNYLPKPDICQRCHVRKPEDVANVTKIYKRDFNNWEWMCQLCHIEYDGLSKNLIPGANPNRDPVTGRFI